MAIFSNLQYLPQISIWMLKEIELCRSMAIFMQWSGRWIDFAAGLIDRNLNHFRFWLIRTTGHSDAELACCDELEWSRDHIVSPALIPLLIAPPMLSNGSLHQLWIRVNRFKQLCHNPNWIPQTFKTKIWWSSWHWMCLKWLWSWWPWGCALSVGYPTWGTGAAAAARLDHTLHQQPDMWRWSW